MVSNYTVKVLLWATVGRGGLPQNTPNLILSTFLPIFSKIVIYYNPNRLQA